MLHFLVTLQSFVMDRVESNKDRGATAVEYGLLVALIAAVIIAVVATLGQDVLKGFETVESKLP